VHLERGDTRKPRRIRHKAVVEEDIGILHAAQRNLVLDLGRPEPPAALLDDKCIDLHMGDAQNSSVAQIDAASVIMQHKLLLNFTSRKLCNTICDTCKSKPFHSSLETLENLSAVWKPHLLRLAAARPDHDDISEGSVAYPALAAVQDPAAAHLRQEVHQALQTDGMRMLDINRLAPTAHCWPYLQQQRPIQLVSRYVA
jgi:hypothetical protein